MSPLLTLLADLFMKVAIALALASAVAFCRLVIWPALLRPNTRLPSQEAGRSDGTSTLPAGTETEVQTADPVVHGNGGQPGRELQHARPGARVSSTPDDPGPRVRRRFRDRCRRHPGGGR